MILFKLADNKLLFCLFHIFKCTAATKTYIYCMANQSVVCSKTVKESPQTPANSTTSVSQRHVSNCHCLFHQMQSPCLTETETLGPAVRLAPAVSR